VYVLPSVPPTVMKETYDEVAFSLTLDLRMILRGVLFDAAQFLFSSPFFFFPIENALADPLMLRDFFIFSFAALSG